MIKKGLQKQKRKMKIAKFTIGLEPFVGKENKLFKGKIHCSCPICSAKTNKLGWKSRDKRIIEGMNFQLKNYMYEE